MSARGGRAPRAAPRARFASCRPSSSAAVVAVHRALPAPLLAGGARLPLGAAPLPLRALGCAFLRLLPAEAWPGGCSCAGSHLRQPRAAPSPPGRKSILARYLPGNVFMFLGRAWMSHRQGLDVDRVTRRHGLRAGPGRGRCAGRHRRSVSRSGTTSAAIRRWALLAVPLIVAADAPARVRAPSGAAAAPAAPTAAHQGAAVPRRCSACSLLCRRLWLVAGLAMWALAAAVTNVTAAAFPGHRRLRGRLRGRHGRVLRAQRARRARGRARGRHGERVRRRWRRPGLGTAARLWQTALELAFVAAATLAARRHSPDRGHAAATGLSGAGGPASAPPSDGDD